MDFVWLALVALAFRETRRSPARCGGASLRAALLAVILIHGASAAQWKIPLGLDLYLPVPDDNPLDPAKVGLGRRLFFERRLSGDGSLSCAGCHNPVRAFSDGRAVSSGVFGRKGPRNVPALINRGYGRSFFWDGRMLSLEEQVLQPIQNRLEMDLGVEEAVARLRQDRRYEVEFRRVFGREVSREDLGRALASFVRTILSGGSRFDRYTSGDERALSTEAREGLRIFRGKGNCIACHVGPNFTDEQFHNTGIAWRDGRPADQGRFAVTHKEEDRGAFKTPTLREAARTAPYMHNGSMKTLAEVVEHYDRGDRSNPHLDVELRPLHPSAREKRALVEFLKSLNGTIQSDPVLHTVQQESCQAAF